MVVLWAFVLPVESVGQGKPKKPNKKKQKIKRTKWDDMDIGPFQAYGLEVSRGGTLWRPALKGLSIKLDDNASVCFDTERLRMAVGWTGGFLKLPTGRDGLEGVPNIVGDIAFRTSMVPGWAGPKDEWTEPNPPKRNGGDVYSAGPLPRQWAKWRGHYSHGNRVVLSYSVGASSVLESPAHANGIFTRQFEITRSPSKSPMSLLVCEVEGAMGAVMGNLAMLEKNGIVTAVAMIGTGVELRIEKGRIIAGIKSLLPTNQFVIAQWSGRKEELGGFQDFTKAKLKLQPLSAFIKGGPAKWPKPVTTRGKLGLTPGAYVVDTITIPENNPWNSWIRCSGFDFFKDGKSAAICSVTGDVWIVSGIDESLKELKWRRYATGLFQPLGLKIVNGQIYVLGRDQITRFHDLNKDGEADFYENFNNDISISNHYHEFCLNLSADEAGNFYYIKGGNLGPATVPHHGCLIKVSKDGSQMEIIATGHRAPNGMSVGPKGEITTADNEGNWVPSSRLNLVKPGGFYGHVHTAHRTKVPTDYDKPLLWIPHQLDNSSGGQAWVTSDKWGPFKGDLLHLSYGKCSLFKIMKEEVNGGWQGAAVRFPLQFESGIMRGRFNPKDGQLYLAGLRVWQSNGARYGAFHRVRYTGKPVYMATQLHVKKNGIAITFTDPLDPVSAVDDQNYAVDQWNYQWTKSYGSKMYSVKTPGKVIGDKKQAAVRGDSMEIQSIKLSDDKKTIFLEIAGLKPVMQSRITFNMKFADGKKLVKQEIIHTINHVPVE